MRDFSSIQRDWENQTLSRHLDELDRADQYESALETETQLQLAELRTMTGQQLADNYVSMDQALEALASDLAAAILAEPAEPSDPEDDPRDYDQYWGPAA